jgi:AraC-like DNA-binding protein
VWTVGDILLLSSLPAATDAMRRALHREAVEGAHHVLRAARGWGELVALAAAAPASALAFVDPYHGGRFAAAEIRRLRAAAPGVEVVALSDFSGRPPADAFLLATLGVKGVVCTSGDGPNALVLAMREHLNRGPLDELVASLAGVVPRQVHRWLSPVLLSLDGPRCVVELARAARCTPRNLGRVLRAAGLPAPARLLSWRLLLHAARLLDDGRSVNSVAAALGLSSGSALRKSCKQLTGLRPAELHAAGGQRGVAARFLAGLGAEPRDGVPAGAPGVRSGYEGHPGSRPY